MSLKKLGRYDLIRVLGKGAMGLVYEGRDPNLDRRVAIKTIKVENLSDQAAAEYEVRFRTEARSAARLQHPNIVSVYDSDRDGDIAFLVMEFVQGDDLKHHLDKGEVYTLQQTLGIMTELLSALDYAHQQKIVHRDIKPANLLVQASGSIKLADFGVARIQDSGDATRTQGSIVGTLKYMSPEQLEGKPIDARADLFAAGVVLYQLLTGKRPFDGETDFAVIQKIVSHTPAAVTFYNSKLPPAIDAVVAKALAKSRDMRYASAPDFTAALQAACKQAADVTIAPVGSMPARGSNSTWTATMLAGESLVATESGVGSLSGVTQGGTSSGTGASLVTQEVELVYWKDIKDSVDVEDLQGFLSKFPAGIYADLARRRLKNLGVPVGKDADPSALTGALNSALTSALTSASTSTVSTTDMEKTLVLQRGSPLSPPIAAEALQEEKMSNAATQALSEPLADSVNDSANDSVNDSKTDSVTDPKTDPIDDPLSVPSSGPLQEPLPRQAPNTDPLPNEGLQDMPVPTAAQANPKRKTVWVLAGVALLFVAGVAFKSMSGSGALPAAGDPLAAGTAPASVSASAPASASASVASAAVSTASAPTASALLAASAPAVAASRPVAAAGAAAVTALRPAAAASRAAAAALKKAATEKDKDSTAKEDPPKTSNAPVAQPARASGGAPASTPAAANSPRTACEDRMLIGFQNCMAEQCGRAVFTNHPICVERRGMDERRRESERNR